MVCTHCYSEETKKDGKFKLVTGHIIQRCKCKSCKKTFILPRKAELKERRGRKNLLFSLQRNDLKHPYNYVAIKYAKYFSDYKGISFWQAINEIFEVSESTFRRYIKNDTKDLQFSSFEDSFRKLKEDVMLRKDHHGLKNLRTLLTMLINSEHEINGLGRPDDWL